MKSQETKVKGQYTPAERAKVIETTSGRYVPLTEIEAKDICICLRDPEIPFPPTGRLSISPIEGELLTIKEISFVNADFGNKVIFERNPKHTAHQEGYDMALSLLPTYFILQER